MSTTTNRYSVSGKAYFAALDPRTTDVPKQEGWPHPERRKVGRGASFVYDLTQEQAHDMALHLHVVGSSFVLNEDDQSTRDEGRACLAASSKIIEAMGGNR